MTKILYSYNIYSNLPDQLIWWETMRIAWLGLFLIKTSKISAQKGREVTISNNPDYICHDYYFIFYRCLPYACYNLDMCWSLFHLWLIITISCIFLIYYQLVPYVAVEALLFLLIYNSVSLYFTNWLFLSCFLMSLSKLQSKPSLE